MPRTKGSLNKKTLEKEKKISPAAENKKISSTLENKKISQTSENNLNNNPDIDIKRQKREEKYFKCELCGKPIPSSPYTINLSYLTGFSLYHRDIPDRIKCCNSCCSEFSDMVEKWMIKKGIKTRLELKQNNDE